jgi:hypothetical protein
VDGKGSYVSDVRAGSGPDIVSLGHALGHHHLPVIAACLRLSRVLGTPKQATLKQNLMVPSGLQAHGQIRADMRRSSVKDFGLSRPPRWGRFFGSLGPH